MELSWEEIQDWIRKSERVLIKKLSRNDCSWADDPGKHQRGVYIPSEIRDSGFLPRLENTNPAKPHILDTRFRTLWPHSGETRLSALKHYTNKGPETHMTRLPKEEFSSLTPASWLIGGLLSEPIADSQYWFMTLDSATEEAELLESLFDLDAEFHCALFAPENLPNAPEDELEDLIGELSQAIKDGNLHNFVRSVSKMPAPSELAQQAQNQYLAEEGLNELNPFELEAPGDVIMRISRDLEYRLYKRAELRFRAAQTLSVLLKQADLVTAVVRGYPELDAVFLSASQTRKSRAGRSFETHLSTLLNAGRIKFEEQAVTGGRRPDFVLPDVGTLMSTKRNFNDAAVISLKTTLRERWKQVSKERFNSSLFLATVDDRVSEEAIAEMDAQGIVLVVPETLKASKDTCYSNRGSVITFRDFFRTEIGKKRGFLIQMVAASPQE